MRTAVFFLLVTLAPLAHADTSWRTPNGDIVTTGMSKVEVIARAGSPTYSEVLSCENAEVQRSAFYYLVGQAPNRLAVTLIFNGTVVERIDTDIVR